jgi:type VI secretion system secreted protein VgrG
MADSILGHEGCAIQGALPYLTLDSAGAAPGREYVHRWRIERAVQPGAYVHTDYDFTKPRADLIGTGQITRAHSQASFEVFDYPALAYERSRSDTYARTRIEEMQAEHEEASGATNCRTVATGCLFQLDGFPRADQNREYLVKSGSYRLEVDDYQSTGDAPPQTFEAHFRAMSSQDPFRPARLTPKPTVQGPQTAMVVGKAGEEIWTDKYARVKIQFPWDRYGKSDENSSCWVRVSQTWAGKNWGGIQIPRIGQEVIVDFLEGDPDRPIITGRVYNDISMPPYALPGNMTQSGVKSRSTKSGTPDNFNEIRFEDKKGSEQVYIHAEKNQDNVVENDETTQVGHDRTENVGNDETITIGHDRTETVGNNETITIGVNRTETVGSDESVTIGKNRTHIVGVNDMLTVGTAQEVTVGATRALTVGSDQTINIGSNLSESVGKDYSESVGKNLSIDAGDSITITTGKASISMKKDGTITIQGKDITVKGSGAINVKASKDVVIKGKKILEN